MALCSDGSYSFVKSPLSAYLSSISRKTSSPGGGKPVNIIRKSEKVQKDFLKDYTSLVLIVHLFAQRNTVRKKNQTLSKQTIKLPALVAELPESHVASHVIASHLALEKNREEFPLTVFRDMFVVSWLSAVSSCLAFCLSRFCKEETQLRKSCLHLFPFLAT